VRDSLGLLLSVRGYRTAVFASGEDFLRAWKQDWAGCLLLDLRMPGMDGLTVQQRLADMGSNLPVIVITGHGDVNVARQAFKAKASDFLEKPIDDAKLIQALEEAMMRESALRQDTQRRERAARLLQDLTPREREVMNLVVTGLHNRNIASTLEIRSGSV
jgi:FixJ family two-component response regulator